jgi:hypothetical protein
MSDTETVPNSIRRVESDSATRLAGFVAAYDDLQTMLRACEALMTALGDPTTGANAADDVVIESLWTLALLSYARAFADGDDGAAVTEDDLDDADSKGEVLKAHRVLLHLRDHHAHASVNPREVYTVGLVVDESADDASKPNVIAVAVTSIRSPNVDAAAVRQAGAIAYQLCTSLDGRISALQELILDEVKDTPRAQIDAMEQVEVVAP